MLLVQTASSSAWPFLANGVYTHAAMDGSGAAFPVPRLQKNDEHPARLR